MVIPPLGSLTVDYALPAPPASGELLRLVLVPADPGESLTGFFFRPADSQMGTASFGRVYPGHYQSFSTHAACAFALPGVPSLALKLEQLTKEVARCTVVGAIC